MADLKIKVGVDTGNSAQNIKKIGDAFADTTQSIGKAKAAVRDAVAQFGKNSAQVKAAANEVARLNQVYEQTAIAIAKADLNKGIGAFSNKLGAAIGGVTLLYEGFRALGFEGEDTQKALLKVQGALAFSQGLGELPKIKEGLKDLGSIGVSAFMSLTASETAATGAAATFGSTLAATGIGALLIGIAAAAVYLGKKISDLSEEYNGNIEALKGYRQAFSDSTVQVKNLGNAIEGYKKGQVSAKEVLDEYNDSIGKVAGSTEDVNEAIRIYNADSGKFIQLTALRAKAQVYYAKAAEAAAKGTTADLEDQTGVWEKLGALTVTFFSGTAAGFGLYKTAQDGAVKDIKDNSKQIDQAFTKEGDALSAQANAIEQTFTRTKKVVKVSNNDILEAQKILSQARIYGATEAQKQIFNIEQKFNEDKKKLQKVGIKDFSAIEAVKQQEIAKVISDSNNAVAVARRNFNNYFLGIIIEGLEKQKRITKDTNDLIFRATLSGIKDEGARRIAELNKNEQDEIDELEKNSELKLNNYKAYEERLKAIREFYRNERANTQTDEQKKQLEELKAFQETTATAIADAANAFGEALASGANPFAAAFKSLAGSLGSYLQDLGKKAILASQLISKLKLLIGTPQGFFAGIALVALGAVIKNAFNKKADKGFAIGGFVSGPGTETSDSIPARLSRGEYVIRARSVRQYGKDFFDKFNKGIVPADPWRALVNRQGVPSIFDPERSRALVNRSAAFREGGYVDPFASYSRALVNRMEVPSIFEPDRSRAIVNRPLPQVPTTRTGSVSMSPDNTFGGVIAETRISGQDLKIILSRADRRYSNVT